MNRLLFFLVMMIAVPSAVQAEWQELTTSRFRIIFDETDRYTAERVADMADRVYDSTTRFVNFEPRERIVVVIYGYTAEANGFFTSYPPHIALFVAGPSGPWLGARADWIETLFVHELVHYLHLTQPIGFFGMARPIIGPAAPSPSLIFMPGWALEGPTVYAETALAPGGRGENPFFEMQHAAPVLEGRMYSYDQAGMSSPFAPGGRFYASGYLIVDHLLREYGEDAFNELNRHFQRWPFLGMRRAVRRTTGLRADELWDNVVAELEDRWAYRLDLPVGTRVSPEEPGNWQLPVATDRGFVTYATGAYRVPGLYVAPAGSDDLDASDLSPDSWQLLAAVQPTDEHSWTVDRAGTTVVVAVVARDRAGTSLFSNRILPSVSNLWVLDLTDTPRGARPAPARQLTQDRQLIHPQVSPDGQRLVAIEREGSYSRLVEVDMARGSVQQLLAVERGRILNPTFDPEGTLVAVSLNLDGRNTILVVSPDEPDRIRAAGPDLPAGAEVHHPRIVDGRDGLELWYGASFLARPESQLPGLYRSTLADTIGRPQLVLEDRISAHAGVPHGPGARDVLYASYSADGFVIRTATAAVESESLADAAWETAVSPQARQGEESTPEWHTARQSSRYYDLPRPILWVPSGRTDIDTADDRLVFTNSGVGATIIAVSNLVRHELELNARWHIQGAQPVGSLQYTFTPGQTSLNIGLSYDLTVIPPVDDEFRQSNTVATTTLSRTLWSRFEPGRTRTLSGSLQARYERQLRVFLENGTPKAPATISERAQFSAGLGLGSSHAGSARDWSTGTPGGTVSTNVTVLPAVLSNPDAIFLSRSTASARVNPWRSRPGLAGGVQISPTVAVVAGNSSVGGDFLPYRAVAATDTASADSSTNLAALGRLEVRAPLPVADAAWRGLGFTSSAVRLFVEQALTANGGIADALTDGLRPVPETILGAELSVRGRFNLIDWPLSAGVSARVPHSGSNDRTAVSAYVRL